MTMALTNGRKGYGRKPEADQREGATWGDHRVDGTNKRGQKGKKTGPFICFGMVLYSED